MFKKRNIFLLMAALSVVQISLAATLCEDAKSESDKIKKVLDDMEMIGIFSDGVNGKIFSGVKNTNSYISEASEFCSVMYGRDDVEKYFYVLDKINKGSGPFAGYISEQLKMGKFIINSANKISRNIGLNLLSIEPGIIEYRLYLEKYGKYWNSGINKKDYRKEIVSVEVLSKNGNYKIDLPGYDGVYTGGMLFKFNVAPTLVQPIYLKVSFNDSNIVYVPISPEQNGVKIGAREVEMTFQKFSDGQFGLK